MFEHGWVTGTSATELPARPAERDRASAVDPERGRASVVDAGQSRGAGGAGRGRVTALDQARTLLARAKEQKAARLREVELEAEETSTSASGSGLVPGSDAASFVARTVPE